MNQQQYPLEGIAEQLASQGRYGDTMLMHVNPAEVEGIAALVPGGQLPRNPMTGQPEAFIGMILGMLAKPLLTKGVAALGAKAGAGALGTALTGLAGSSAAMTGITSGLIETARTGDIKKGFTSGLMGAGIGKALGAATGAVDEGVKGATENIEGLTADLAGAEKAIGSLEALKDAGTNLTDAQQLALTQQEAIKEGITGGIKTGANFGVGGMGPPSPGSMELAKRGLSDARIAAGKDFGSLGDVFQEGGFKAATSAITKPEAFLPLALGASQRAEIDYQDAMEAEGRRMEEEKAAEEQYSRDLMERSFEQIRQDYPEMDNQYNPYAYAQGGIVSIDPTQYAQTLQGLSDVAGPIDMNAGGVVNMVEGGPASMVFSPSGAGKGSVGGATGGRGSPAARNRQAKIRGTTLVAPEAGYRPGFDAEHRFFQNIAKEGADPVTTPAPPKDVTIPPFPEGELMFSENPFMNAAIGDAMSGLSPQFLGMEGLDPSEFMDLQKSADSLGQKGVRARKKLRNLQDKQSKQLEKAAEFESEMAGITAIGREDDFKGGVALDEPVRIQRQETEVTAPAAMMDDAYLSGFNPRTVADFSNFQPRFTGSIGMQEGGITEVAAQEQMVEQPVPEDAQLGALIEQTAMAVLGQVSEEEAEIIINRFIDEFGQEAFQMLREQVLQGVVPDAQTQGLVDGPGGGMDDQVQGMIGDQQRVAVSPGEFIVPADVVSGLGDGDTDAGADELDAMMDRVRVERTGTTEQPPRLSAGGLLPA